MASGAKFGNERRPAVDVGQPEIAALEWAAIPLNLLDPDSNAGNGVRVDHRSDLLAAFDDDEVNVHGRERITRDRELPRPRAIGIDFIGPGRRRPVDRRRHAVDSDEVDLRHLTLAIEIGHGNTAEREFPGRDRHPRQSQNNSFHGKPVVAIQASIRALRIVVSPRR